MTTQTFLTVNNNSHLTKCRLLMGMSKQEDSVDCRGPLVSQIAAAVSL